MLCVHISELEQVVPTQESTGPDQTLLHWDPQLCWSTSSHPTSNAMRALSHTKTLCKGCKGDLCAVQIHMSIRHVTLINSLLQCKFIWRNIVRASDWPGWQGLRTQAACQFQDLHLKEVVLGNIPIYLLPRFRREHRHHSHVFSSSA